MLKALSCEQSREAQEKVCVFAEGAFNVDRVVVVAHEAGPILLLLLAAFDGGFDEGFGVGSPRGTRSRSLSCSASLMRRCNAKLRRETSRCMAGFSVTCPTSVSRKWASFRKIQNLMPYSSQVRSAQKSVLVVLQEFQH